MGWGVQKPYGWTCWERLGAGGEEIAELTFGWHASLCPVEDRGSLGRVLKLCSSRKLSTRLMRSPWAKVARGRNPACPQDGLHRYRLCLVIGWEQPIQEKQPQCKCSHEFRGARTGCSVNYAPKAGGQGGTLSWLPWEPKIAWPAYSGIGIWAEIFLTLNPTFFFFFFGHCTTYMRIYLGHELSSITGLNVTKQDPMGSSQNRTPLQCLPPAFCL